MKIKILYASRLVHEKGVDILIECIQRFASHPSIQKKVEWIICSDGDERDTIVGLAQANTHITYHGRVSGERLLELYSESSILFMPSRFLEIFGLTALEALSAGIPVCGPYKGGLRDFITDGLILDETNPVESFVAIIEKMIDGWKPALPDISRFTSTQWQLGLGSLFAKSKNILIAHDYRDKIGGAEYYVESVEEALNSDGKSIYFFGYMGHTTPWKRRIMFIFSILAFWRGICLYNELKRVSADTIWMHSILRYIGPWGILAVRIYTEKSPTVVYLSHHDLGLLAAFPQDITQEYEIPQSTSLGDFIPEKSTLTKKITSIGKWFYVRFIFLLLPKETIHIIFASFLEESLSAQLGSNTEIHIFPHQAIVRT